MITMFIRGESRLVHIYDMLNCCFFTFMICASHFIHNTVITHNTWLDTAYSWAPKILVQTPQNPRPNAPKSSDF